MMVATEQEDIGQARIAAVRPVTDVMAIREPEPTSGEAAAPIPDFQRTPKGRWNRAGLPAHVEDLAALTVPHPHEAGVAAEPPRRFS
jgi:hypothetical protein